MISRILNLLMSVLAIVVILILLSIGLGWN